MSVPFFGTLAIWFNELIPTFMLVRLTGTLCVKYELRRCYLTDVNMREVHSMLHGRVKQRPQEAASSIITLHSSSTM